VGTASSLDGTFKVTLPAGSVTTLIMTNQVSNRR
jgi:O-glycosyl hydrolase